MPKTNKYISMELRQWLCDKVKMIKRLRGHTYDQMIEHSDGIVNRTQLIRILTKDGDGVSTDLIFTLINAYGYCLEVELYNPRLGINMDIKEEEWEKMEEYTREY